MQPLYNVNHVITCNNNTSTYESHASLSVKMSSVLKNIVFCFTFAAAQCAKSSQTEYPRWKLRIAHDPAEFIERWIFRVLFYVRGRDRGFILMWNCTPLHVTIAITSSHTAISYLSSVTVGSCHLCATSSRVGGGKFCLKVLHIFRRTNQCASDNISPQDHWSAWQPTGMGEHLLGDH